MQTTKTFSAKRFAKGAVFCPACRVRMEDALPQCPACGFTGEHTLKLFPGGAPCLQQIIDTDAHWSEKELVILRKEIKKMCQHFPQIHWAILSIPLAEEVSLPLFNFWFFNVSPLDESETIEQRQWTILLTLDRANQRAAVTAGYIVEPFVADDEWERSLIAMKPKWKAGNEIGAIREFFAETKKQLIHSHARVQELLTSSERGKL